LHARIPPEDRGSSRSETVVTHGAPAAEILRVATERSASLIVIGTHGRTGLIRLALGSVAERVVGEATCPVLVGPLTSGSASRRHVIVVGAGPAGAALSLLLARNGVRVTLVERERDFDRAFRGEALMPTGLDALYAMGIRAKLDSLPWRPLEAWEIYLDRRPIMHVNEPTAELGDRALRVVPQPQLL
jgi:NADPH-dependent 2,4-dienoyl-CoA reductase/sulfur reductase-like enzyme